ncbi:site-specific integrase [Shimwellia blattae]|uniref:Putative phage integrase n=1 Tax=Shimwellia blattae (strain ATCC 29907 / DSM 4481 / JCM 1650 / NBRC 105725 / CDC 9005-74) TaxID=630626 RepID=I2B9H7_SHIBC|nr:site-specific integrase [Shimwellia blattae]AFJ47181.1 putative phage integrase [Shimwellia blattae DSM 4481 = NBRC 105725]GAB82287.1 putative prophage Rac integrase [Shimwellia blattae DSM 4481 = NBRC 105725]VDY64673.1 Integrase [Shimwellia blattae]VEC22777.1 Integrase [Shimwellia blattae]
MAAVLPTGVEIHSDKIRLNFLYRGIRCREVLKGWEVTKTNIRKAGNLRHLIISQIQNGTFNYRDHFPESPAARRFGTTLQVHTWGELVNLWLTTKEEDISFSTLCKIRAQLVSINQIIAPGTEISAIRHSDILRYRKALLHGENFYPDNSRRKRKGRSAETVDNYISLVCQILRFAYRSKFINDKPFEFIPKLRKDRNKPEPLMREEYEQLLAALSGQDNNLWKFAINSGIRHGELAALAWGDVNLDAGTVHICRNLTNQNQFVRPKTRAGDRVITLLAPALEALKAQFVLTGHLPETAIEFVTREVGKTRPQKQRFVFLPGMKTRRPGQYFQVQSVAQRWNAAVKKSGIRRRAPYQTRHTFACWLLSAGANPSFIASQLGHEDAQMVYRVYSSWIQAFDGDQVAQMNERLWGV